MLPGRTYDAVSIARLLMRRKVIVLIPILVGSVAAYAMAQRMPNLYRSETTILVVPQSVPEIYVRSTVTARIEDRLRTITQQILSRTRLEQIVGEFDLYAEERRVLPMETVVAMMRDEVDLQVTRSDSFRLAFVYRDPVTAMKVTGRLATLFIEENVRDRGLLAEGTNRFLEDQLDDARSRLLEQEKKIEGYRLRHSGELPSQLPSNLQVIQNTQLQVQALLDGINRDRDRRDVVERMIADFSMPTAVPADPASTADPLTAGRSATEQLDAATTQLRSLETRLTAAHPDVVRMRKQVADLAEKAEVEQAEQARRKPGESAATSLTASAVNSAELARLNRLASLRAEREALDRQVAQRLKEEEQLRQTVTAYQARVEMVPTRESEMIGLTRDYDTLQNSYRTLLAKKEESQIATNLERQQSGEQFRILDPARIPESPFSPNRLLIQLAGSLAGFAIGLAFVGLIELRDQTLRTHADVLQALDLPVLAVVPVIVSVDGARRNRLMKVGVTAVALVVVSALAAGWSLLF